MTTDTTEKPVLSGWCSTPPGITNHDSAHRVCQMRLDDDDVDLDRCDCPDHTNGDTP